MFVYIEYFVIYDLVFIQYLMYSFHFLIVSLFFDYVYKLYSNLILNNFTFSKFLLIPKKSILRKLNYKKKF